MQKSYSRKDRERKKMFQALAIAFVCIMLSITFVIMFNELTGNNNTGGYTAEQMLHDHDGDGVPDH